ncbi:MAG: DUF4249 family protein [Saprospiraceae bacterium]
MKYLKYIIPVFFVGLLVSSCNLEKEIDLELPEYSDQPVVECYLQPGEPFRLLLTRSSSYFAPFDTSIFNFIDNILEKEATVNIRYNGMIIPLEEGNYIDPNNFKVYNYGNEMIVPEDFENEFELEIVLKDGTTIGGTTRMLPAIAIDSVVVQFPETGRPKDTLARVLTYLTDPDVNSENFFRRQLHWNSLTDSFPDQDFITNDKLIDNSLITFGTGFNFPEGDSVINTVYHISPAYYDYLESVFNASSANLNPFGQPSTIVSNVNGSSNPLGIFTGLTYSRTTTVIRK